MRKYLYLITEHPDDEKVGKVIASDKPRHTAAEKNTEGVTSHRDLDTGETWESYEVGLGYVDFEDEDDYVENWTEAVQEKFEEIDDEHLEKAGVEVGGAA